MDVRRSIVVALVVGILGAPLVGEAQQARRLARIGFLSTGALSDSQDLFKVFRERLRELGHIEGQTIAFTARGADGNNERLPELRARCINRKFSLSQYFR